MVHLRLFVRLIQQLVRRQDNGGLFRNKKILLHLQIILLEFFNLSPEDDWIQHHAIANNIFRRLPENT